MLIPVGIIGFGYGERTGHREHIKELCNFVGDDRSFGMYIDILGDRSNPQTQIAVLSQPEFAGTVATCFEELIDKLLEYSRGYQPFPTTVPLMGMVVAVGCFSGEYQSDVLRRVLAELLNSVQFDGERVFNACDFSLNGCKSFAENK